MVSSDLKKLSLVRTTDAGDGETDYPTRPLFSLDSLSLNNATIYCQHVYALASSPQPLRTLVQPLPNSFLGHDSALDNVFAHLHSLVIPPRVIFIWPPYPIELYASDELKHFTIPVDQYSNVEYSNVKSTLKQLPNPSLLSLTIRNYSPVTFLELPLEWDYGELRSLAPLKHLQRLVLGPVVEEEGAKEEAAIWVAGWAKKGLIIELSWIERVESEVESEGDDQGGLFSDDGDIDMDQMYHDVLAYRARHGI